MLKPTTLSVLQGTILNALWNTNNVQREMYGLKYTVCCIIAQA